MLYGGKLGSNLLKLGYLEPETLAYFLSDKLEVPYAHPRKLSDVDKSVLDVIPREVVEKYRILPFDFKKKRLRVVMADPLDLDAIKEISFITGYVIESMVAPESTLMEALKKHYGIADREREPSGLKGGNGAASAARESAPGSGPPQPSDDTSQELIKKKLEELKGKRRKELLGEEGSETSANSKILPEKTVDGLKKAPGRDAVGQVLLDFIGERYGSGALLISQNERALGWKGVGSQLSDEVVARIRIPLEVPTTLNEAAADGMAIISEPGKHPMDKMLRKLLHVEAGADVVVTGVYYREVIVCYLVALVPAGSVTDNVISELQELSRLANEAFARLIVERRKKEKNN